MKRKFFHRILPILMAVLMVIGTLPADFGFSAEAYASGNSEKQYQFNVENVNIGNRTPLKNFRVEFFKQNPGGGSFITNLQLYDGQEYRGTSNSISATDSDVYSYTIKSDNYDITGQGSTGSFVASDGGFTVNAGTNLWSYTEHTNLTITAEPQSGSGQWGSPVTFTATLKDSDSKPIANASLNFSCNGSAATPQPSSGITNENGQAEFTVTPANMTSITVTAQYAGAAETYKGCTQTLNYQPAKKNVTLTLERTEAQEWGQDVTLTAMLKDAEKPISGENVIFTTSDGNELGTAPTDTNGKATLNVPGEKFTSAKAVEIKATLSSSSALYQVSNPPSITYTPKKIDVNLKMNEPALQEWNTSVTLTATLTDQQGMSISGQDISFKVNGEIVSTVQTGTNGIATCQYTFENAKKVTISAELANEAAENYEVGISSQNSVEYTPAKVSPKGISLSVNPSSGSSSWQGEVTLTANLTPVNGVAFDSDATVTFYVNGALYDAPVNVSDNKAVITWNGATAAGTVDFKASFNGDSNYKEISGEVKDYSFTKATPSLTWNSVSESLPWKQSVELKGQLLDEKGHGLESKQIILTTESGTLDIGTGTASESVTVTTDSDGTFTVILSPVKAGAIKVTAKFAGDANFNSAEENVTYTPLQESQSFTVVDDEDNTISEVAMEYGDPEKNGQTYALKLRDEDAQDQELSTRYEVSGFDKNIVNVQVINDTQEIVFKPVNVGTTEVIITQKANDDYETSTQTVKITVTPYELKLVNTEPIKTQGTVASGGRNENDSNAAWSNVKTYDATNKVDVRAELEVTNAGAMGLSEEQMNQLKDLLVDGRYLIVSNVEAADVIHVADSGKEFDIEFTMPAYTLTVDGQNEIHYQNFVFADGNENTQKVSMTVKASITIQQRSLTMQLSDAFTRQYNKDNTQENFVIPEDVIIGVTGYADAESEDVKTEINALEAGWEYFTVADSINRETVMGQYVKAITIEGEKLESFNNQVLKPVNKDYIFAGSDGGMVTITEEDVIDFTQYISLNTMDSIHAYQNGDKIYYGEDASAIFDTVAPYNTVYRVLLDKYGEIVKRDKIDAKNPQKFTDVSSETYIYCLAYVTDENIKVGETAPFEITFYRDQKMPTANIIIDEVDNAVQEFGKNITFGLYQNKTYDAQITVYDEEAQDQQDYASGVFSVSYQIVNFAEDFEFDADATVIDDEVFEKLINSEFTTVSSKDDIYNDGNGMFTASVKVPETDPEEIGNYVVFVRVQDNVGNAMIYGSNGMIFENVPITDVTINFDEDSNNNKTNYKGADYFASGEDVDLTITAKEDISKGVYSGVKDITYSVVPENKGSLTVDEEGIFSQEVPEDVTLAQLESQYSSLTGAIEQIYTKEAQSQIVTVTASATDFAGNESQPVSRKFTIDPVAPVIENILTSEAQVQNGKYYKKDVAITTTITERFLDMENKLVYTINGSTMTLSELMNRKAEFGISSINVDYGKDGSVGESRSDQSKSTVTITFHTDGEYTISSYVSDYAGNVSETTPAINFVVDQTVPVVSATYYSYGTGQTFAPGSSSDAPYYLNQNYSSFKAVVSVSELNFEMDGNVNTNLTIGAKNFNNETTDAMAAIMNTHGTNVKSAKNWSDPSGIVRTYTVDVNVDANYSFDFTYTDLAGNEANVIPTAYVTLDRVVPSGEIIVNGFVNGVDGNNNATQKSWFEKFISAITFNLFGKDSVTASMKSSDVTSGMASTQYIATSALLSKAQLAARTDWRDYTGNIHLAANENVIVYEKVTDRAGNTEYYSTENIVVDNVDPAPEVTITPSAPAWGKGVYAAGDHPGFDISVTDPSVNNAYSGLKEITYQIVNGTTGHTETGTLATFNRNEHTQNWTGHVSIDPEAFYSNDVQITVSASDWSTNEATSETQTLKVDNKNPIVTFSFSTADVLNGKYYKNNKTLTITVDERNFDPSYTPTVTSSSGGGYSFSGWSSNGEIHTGVVTFSGDSDYTVTFDCYDLAGNHSNTENLAEFTVDKTLPTVSVSYNNNDVLNGHYYSDTRTATVTITEHNFRASDARATITAALNGAGISAPSISGWSTSGDRHTATVSFNSDGDYTFDIAYTDLAGNAMADYAQDSFTVDLTNPEIEITGVENRSANKGTVAPVITLTDTNYTANGVTLTLTGADKGRINVDAMVSRSAVTNGQTITFRNFGENMDDIYTLTAKLVDQAGNETTRSITFSVNRDGSTYKLNDYTAQLVQSGFTNSPKDIVIQEVNVDTLEFIEITYTKDGEVVTLKEGVDYTVEEEGGDGQWKVYTYTIKASCFEEEGQYSINIYSEDRAKNTSTYQAKNSKLEEEEQMTLEFVVDKTAPSVSIANLEDRGRYRENVHEFTLSVKDNMLLSYVELYLDGVLYHTYSGDELTVEDGVLTIPVDSKNAYQTVKIIAYDAAGNPTDPVEYQVLVTSNWWIQFYMNKPLFFGCIAGIVVIAGVIIFLVVKRSKKDNKNYKKI